jgi:hypothetical protein
MITFLSNSPSALFACGIELYLKFDLSNFGWFSTFSTSSRTCFCVLPEYLNRELNLGNVELLGGSDSCNLQKKPHLF